MAHSFFLKEGDRMAYQSYITKDFYRNTYPSINKFAVDPQNPTTEEDALLDAAIFDASRDVDQMTVQRATKFGTDDWDDDLTECLQYMTAAQVDYIAGIGYDPDTISKLEGSTGYRIGNYAENNAPGVSFNDGDFRQVEKISPKAKKYGRQCGLTYRGLGQKQCSTKYSFPNQIGDEDVR